MSRYAAQPGLDETIRFDCSSAIRTPGPPAHHIVTDLVYHNAFRSVPVHTDNNQQPKATPTEVQHSRVYQPTGLATLVLRWFITGIGDACFGFMCPRADGCVLLKLLFVIYGFCSRLRELRAR